MLKLAGVTSDDVVYDLGCGDGRIVITAAKLYGAHGVGIDIDPQRIREANENAKKAGVERLVRFEENDLFKANIREASVVTLFLLTSVNARLRPKLLRELRSGTRVVSNTFEMGDWKPDKEFTVDTRTRAISAGNCISGRFPRTTASKEEFMRHKKLIAAGIFGVGVLTLVAVRAQQKPTLTAMDYIEIQQLANRYAQAIDTCSNNGYDYADLYTPDGEFVDNITEEGYKKGGLVRAKGREQLAAAAGGGSLGCKNVGWKDWSHLMVNHVITPTPEGASGRVYLVTIGEKGPRDVTRYGGYEDQYVKTSAGWRIKKRTHVRNKAWDNPLLQSPDLN